MFYKLLPFCHDQAKKLVPYHSSKFGLIPNELFKEFIVPFLVLGKENIFDMLGLLFASKVLLPMLMKLIEPRYFIKTKLFGKRAKEEIEKLSNVLNKVKRVKLYLTRFRGFNLIKKKIPDCRKITELEIRRKENIDIAFQQAVLILVNNDHLRKVSFFDLRTKSELVLVMNSNEIILDLKGDEDLIPREEDENNSKIYRICQFAIAYNAQKRKPIIINSIDVNDSLFIHWLRLLREFGSQLVINKISGKNTDGLDALKDDDETLNNISYLKGFIDWYQGQIDTKEVPAQFSDMSFEIDCDDMGAAFDRGFKKVKIYSEFSTWNEMLNELKSICSNIDIRISLSKDQLSIPEIIKELMLFKKYLTSITLYDSDKKYLSTKQWKSSQSDIFCKSMPVFAKIGKDFSKLELFRFQDAIKVDIYPSKREVEINSSFYLDLPVDSFISEGLKIRGTGLTSMNKNGLSYNDSFQSLMSKLTKLKGILRFGTYFTNNETEVWCNMNEMENVVQKPFIFDMNGWLYKMEKPSLDIEINLNKYLVEASESPSNFGRIFIDPIPRVKALAQFPLCRKVVKVEIDFPKLFLFRRFFSKKRSDSQLDILEYPHNYANIINSLKPFAHIKNAKFIVGRDIISSCFFKNLFLDGFAKEHKFLEEMVVIPDGYNLEIDSLCFDLEVRKQLLNDEECVVGLFNGGFSYVEQRNGKQIVRNLVKPDDSAGVYRKMTELFAPKGTFR
ncbi:hypothetical protein ACFLZV_06940 [Candidatus Margulisiibacteriota bacterium]